MQNEETLPTPRRLLTTLISSLSSIPINTTDNVPSTSNLGSSHRPANQQASTNPFRLIPPIYRPILTTLHVLYPSTLLPALDLLDRRLVTRVLLRQDTEPTPAQPDPQSHPLHPENQVTDSDPPKHTNKPSPPLYYLVRSAQPQSRSRHQTSTTSSSSSGGGQAYAVHLESWNCSCAAFAFSAFPPLSSSSLVFSSPSSSSSTSGTGAGYQIISAPSAPGEKQTESGAAGMDMDIESDDADADSTRAWEFGGLSTDGKDGGADDRSVPCCKHLLACVLAERWEAVLGGYVEERLVSREEGAGLVGDL